MSKAKSQAPAADLPPEPVKDPFANVDADEAWERFAPFVFTIDSDTKDTVDLKGTLDIMARDPNLAVGTTCFILDRKEVLEWFAACDPTTGHAVVAAQQVGEVKAQLTSLLDGGGDINLVAMAFKMRLRYFALVREAQRLEEVEAAQVRHEEMVERLMEEGLTRKEAEAAAQEEEAAAAAAEEEALAAANAAEDGEQEVSTRPVTYAFLKGFPTITEHVKALLAVGVVMNGVLVVNCNARFGRRDEPAALDPKGKGKKPEPKKAEVKKASGKGKGNDDAAPAPTESLGLLLSKDVSKLPRFERHPLSDVLVWTLDIAAVENAKQLDESMAGIPGFGWDLQETEAEIAEKLAAKIVSLELAGLTYQQWNAAQQVQSVPILLLSSDGGSTARTNVRPMTSDTPQPVADEVKKPSKPPPAPKKGGKAPKKEEEDVEVAPLAPPPPPPLPSTVEELPANNELYQRLVDEVSIGNTSITIQLHCMLEQVQETNAPATSGEGKSTANAVAETIAFKNRRDVADFADYVLASLNGQQEVVFEACRRRRLKAAEAGGDGGTESEGAQMINLPYHVGDTIRLDSHSLNTIDGGALLLGLPLSAIEARLIQAAYKQSTYGLTTLVKTDSPSLSTFEDAQHLISQLLREKCGCSATDAQSLVNSRTHAEILSARQYGERISDVSLFSSTTKVVEAHCLDGSKVIILLHSHPNERKRWRSTWCHLHGHMTFPRWLQWQDHVEKENLFFNPPPKNDDDDDEEELQQEAEEEEEEEEEEDEDELDEDGNPVKKERNSDDDLDLDMDDEDDKPKKKKKKKKVIHYDPEYVDFEMKATEDQRRRATMEHLKIVLARGAPSKGVPSEENYQSLLANNHSASVAYEEESFLFPDDGSVISTGVSRINTVGVNCSVHSGQGLLFGFRSTIPSGKTPLDLHGPEKKSGVCGIISIRNEALIHIECSATAPPPASIAADAPPETPHGAADSTMDEQPGRSDTPAGSAPTTQMPTVSTVVRCSSKGVTITVDTEKGSVLFEMGKESARDCPVCVYQATTKQAVRIFVSEVSRTVLSNGVVMSTYSDGTKMNLFPKGNTAVLHKGIWMITNSQGRRILKNAETGQLSPVVRSLVTTNTDVETQSKVTTREDGVVTVHYDDGRMLVQHIEGTRFWQDANRSIIEIETEGLPLLCCTDSPASRLTPTPSPTPAPGDEPSVPSRESLLCIKFMSGLYLSVRPKKRVTIGHFHMGFQAALELSAYVMRVVPNSEFDNTYSIDYAFGGLRSTDQTFAYNVTPFGRCRSRSLQEETAEIVLDPTVKQVIDVFGGLEVVSSLFAEQIAKTGFDVATQSLHRQSTVAVKDATVTAFLENDTIGFAPPPRSRQMKDKERQCVGKLRSLIPEKGIELPQNLPPHIFVVQPGGAAFELFRREDVKDIVKGAVAHSDLLHSDVFKKQILANEEKKDGAYFEHSIMSVSPVKPVERPGIPKIILDIRSGHSSAPMSVAHFLQELRQGPSHGNNQTQSSSEAQLSGEVVVTCATRHMLHFPGSEGEKSADKRPLPSVLPADPLYQEAATSLSQAIPPVIAAQLSVQRTAQQMAAGREALGKVTRQGSRAESNGKSRGTLPSRRKGHNSPPRSGAGSSSAKKTEQDEEFAKQMEELRSKERANRKPWPDPIQDLKAKKAAITSSNSTATTGSGTFSFWSTDEGAAEVETLTKENEKFKAKNGFKPKKVDNMTASPVKPSIRKPADLKDAPPVRAVHQDAATKPAGAEVTALTVALPNFDNTGASQNNGSNKVSLLRGKRIVATPGLVNFGSLVEGFRYSTTAQLTNVAVGACRYSLSVPAEYSSWLSVDATKAPIAAGMSARIDIEVGGTQPVGSTEGAILVDYEGGQTMVEVVMQTRGSGDKPVPHPRGVRMIGPVKLHYKPGGTVKALSFDRSKGPVSMENPKYNTLDDGDDSD